MLWPKTHTHIWSTYPATHYVKESHIQWKVHFCKSSSLILLHLSLSLFCPPPPVHTITRCRNTPKLYASTQRVITAGLWQMASASCFSTLLWTLGDWVPWDWSVPLCVCLEREERLELGWAVRHVCVCERVSCYCAPICSNEPAAPWEAKSLLLLVIRSLTAGGPLHQPAYQRSHQQVIPLQLIVVLEALWRQGQPGDGLRSPSCW